MNVNKNISTVVKKAGAVKGRYRKREYIYIAGKKTYSAEYKENGASLRFDIRDTFFSTRLSFERSRIAALSKKSENVMVMFAGVGPFAIELAIKNKDARIVAVEINRKAVRYMKENIRLNGIKNIKAIAGNVKKLPQEYENFADRIIMPLPKDSISFLDDIIRIGKKHCVVHYYAFVEIENGVEKLEKTLRQFFSDKNVKFNVIMWRTVRPYSAKIMEIVIDFEINKKI